MEEAKKQDETAQLGIGAVIGWVSVSDKLPELHSWFLPAEDSMIDEFLSNQ